MTTHWARPSCDAIVRKSRFAARPQTAGVIIGRAMIAAAPKLRCGYAAARPAEAVPVKPSKTTDMEEWPSG